MDVGYIWLIVIMIIMILSIYIRSNAWINYLNNWKQKNKDKKR